MSSWVIAAIVIVALLGLGLVLGPRLARGYVRASALSDCEKLAADIENLRTQGGDLNLAAQKERELQRCYGVAKDAGAVVDLGEIRSRNCEAQNNQIVSEFASFKATDYADILARGNKRGTIKALGQSMVVCFRQAVNESDTVGGLDAIRVRLLKAISDSTDRSICYGTGASGCSRYLGSSESDEHTKQVEEDSTILEPLRVVLGELDAKRRTMTATTPTIAIPGLINVMNTAGR